MRSKYLTLLSEEKLLAIVCVVILILASGVEGLSITMLVPLVSQALGSEAQLPIYDLLPSYVFDLQLVNFALVIFFVFVVKFIIITLKNFMIFGLEWRIRIKWIQKLFAFNLEQNLVDFSKIDVGDNSSFIFNESLKAASAIRQVFELIAQIITIALFSLILWYTNPIGFYICVMIGSVYVGLTYSILSPKLRSLGNVRQYLETKIFNNIANMTAGMASIRSYSLQNLVQQNVQTASNSLHATMRLTETLKRLPSSTLELILVTGIISGIVYFAPGDNFLIDYFPTLILFAMLGAKLNSLVSSLASNVSSILALSPSVDIIAKGLDNGKLLNSELSRQNTLRKKSIGKISEIELKNLSFEYNTGNAVIENVTLTIKSPYIGAIYGASGSGKSTLGLILSLLIDECLPKIYLNDIRSDQILPTATSGKFLYVGENDFFFPDSILDNLKNINPDVKVSEVINLIEELNLSQCVAGLTDGIYGKLEPNNSNISSGQKARLSVLRAIVQNPDVVIFDEITGPMDEENKLMTLGVIKNRLKDKIVIFITHDEILKQNLQNILVLKNKTLNYME